MPLTRTQSPAAGAAVTLAFDAGAEELAAPLTWGQLSMWTPMQWFGDQANQFNLKATVQPPEPVTPDRAAAIIRTLIEAHQATRTHFVPGPDGPRQRVAARGSFTIQAASPVPDEQAALDALTADLAASAFEHATQWPLRLGWIVNDEGLVTHLILVASHLAFDGWALQRLGEEMLELLRRSDVGGDDALDAAAAPASPAAASSTRRRWQPVDQATFENSAEGMRKNDAALRHWRERLATVPASMFDFPEAPTAGAKPVEKYRFDAEAVVPAARILAGRTGTTASTVLLCASALILAAYAGQDSYTFKLIVGNRHDRNSRELLTITAQDGLLTLPVDDVDLCTAIKTAYRPMLAAYQRGQCNPLALGELIADVGYARGVAFDLSAFFNDKRIANAWTAWNVPSPSRAEFDRLRRQSRFTQVASMEKSDMKYCVGVADAGDDRARLTLLVDTAFVPRPVGEAMLRGIETLLCDAALGEVGVAEIADRIGIRKRVREAGWLRSPVGWIRPTAVADLVRQAAGGAPTAVFPHPHPRPGEVPGGSDLTAYIAVGGIATGNAAQTADHSGATVSLAPTPDQIHRRVMDLLPAAPGTAAPSWYVFCDRPPSEAEGPGTEAAWRARATGPEGPGRAAHGPA